MIVTRQQSVEVDDKESEFQISFPADGNADKNKVKEDIQFKMSDFGLEFDFFKMLVLSVILGQPKFFIN